MPDEDGNSSATKATKQSLTLSHPRDMKPEDILDFILLKPFERRWKKLGLDDGDDLKALKVLIMTNPRANPVIQGTGGIRKMRFSSDGWNGGLRGGVRVLYKHFEGFGIVLLCLVYAKNEADDVSPSMRKQLKQIVQETEVALERRQIL